MNGEGLSKCWCDRLALQGLQTMEIRQLRYFLDIAQTEHLTDSARNLFVTQSTLSHGLRQLEDELGMQLFERAGRGLRLSQAGQVFRQYAERALREVEAGRSMLADISGLNTGTLTVGANPTFLSTLVVPTVAAFAQRYPRIAIDVRELQATPIEEQLRSGLLDMGISFYPYDRPDIDAEALFDERMQLVVGLQHPLAGRKRMALADVAAWPLALLQRSFYTRRLMDQQLRSAGVDAKPVIEIGSVQALMDLVKHGPWACIVPERAVHSVVGVHAIALHPPMVRTAALLWRKNAVRSTAAQAFADMLRGIAASPSTAEPVPGS